MEQHFRDARLWMITAIDDKLPNNKQQTKNGDKQMSKKSR